MDECVSKRVGIRTEIKWEKKPPINQCILMSVHPINSVSPNASLHFMFPPFLYLHVVPNALAF